MWNDSHRPLTWYDQATGSVIAARKPFARYFSLDPSENPTVRPEPLFEAGSGERVFGEEHLIIIGRRLLPSIG
ncbi:MAG: hypothetical protein U1E65_12715 [Myxococcota bacterium]